jgi:hypothetical protein
MVHSALSYFIFMPDKAHRPATNNRIKITTPPSFNQRRRKILDKISKPFQANHQSNNGPFILQK